MTQHEFAIALRELVQIAHRKGLQPMAILTELASACIGLAHWLSVPRLAFFSGLEKAWTDVKKELPEA